MNATKPFGRLGSRGSARLAANLEASFKTPAQAFRVIVRDISRHGAGIETTPEAALGFEGVLTVGSLAMRCSVVWTCRSLGGLKFYRPLNKGQMCEVQRMVEEGETSGLVRFATASHTLSWRSLGGVNSVWGSAVSPAAARQVIKPVKAACADHLVRE
jgi:hypothetical protein